MGPKQRTRILLDRIKNKDTEWVKLHGILCMAHGWDGRDAARLYKLLDMHMIAARMDEINARLGTPITDTKCLDKEITDDML